MIKRFSMVLIAWMLLTQCCFSQLGLPQWPLVTAAPQYLDFPANTVPNEFIDWTAGTPAFTTIPGTSSNRAAPTQVGINACNQMVFFLLHNGDLNMATSFLRLYTPAGVYMPLPGADMNANAGDDEVQVVRRPGYSNQWFVIYSMAAPSTSGHPGYTCSNLAYSLIQINGLTATYVLDAFLAPIQDRILQVGINTFTYMQGKATSRQSVVTGFNHDIYVQRRAQNSNTVMVDRFSVDGSDAIVHTGNSTAFNDYWWFLMAAGSPLELSPNNTSLAVMARSDVDGQQNIYIFDVTTSLTLANPPDIIALDQLQIQFTAPPLPLLGTSYQAQLFNTPQGTNFEWLKNFERKINGIEFSPNGDYLYITGGGYVASGTNNITYLGQIDLLPANLIGGNHPVRLQVQTSDVTNSYTTVFGGLNTGGGNTWGPIPGTYGNYWPSHQLSNIESCYDTHFYFTKSNSSEIFVLPSPNAPLPINMTPHDIDMTVGPITNIPTASGGYAAYLPDQIDGLDYGSSNFVNLSLIVSNQCFCGCDTLSVNVTDSAGNSVGGFFIDDCPDTVSICVPNSGSYNLVGSNGVIYTNAIVNGIIMYPGSSGLFGFGCLANSSASFTIIDNTNNYINADDVWEGKYIIEDNVILTVDAAILDLTNVDLIFGKCAGIDFINGAHMRANNSVFRPCAIDGTWRGVQFASAGPFDNIINECTFKNAETALYFNNIGAAGQAADGVVSNNLFSNCNEAVRISANPAFDHPISGNHFLIDDFFPSFQQCYPFTNPTNCYGIIVTGSRILSEFSQNEFIYSKEENTGSAPLTSIGILLGKSSGMISENTFTNFRNPIVLSRAASYVDNNEIEYNNDFTPSFVGLPVAGISVFQCNSIVEMTNNEIRDNSNSGVISYGIYNSQSTRTSARHNMIDGFDIAIYFDNDNSIEITENIITKASSVGIWLEVFNQDNINYITCNDITMLTHQGIGIYTQSVNELTNITSNCIKDANMGIYTFDPSASLNMPYIRNNYIYNYAYGIYNDGHTGDIGVPGDPGLNTLWSNDNFAFDIASTTTIQVADNFGMFNITFPQVMISSGNPYHSTASCGQQIFNMPSQGNLNNSWVCDNTKAIYHPMVMFEGEIHAKNDNLPETMQESVHPMYDLVGMIQSLTEINEQELVSVVQEYLTDENEKNIALFYLYFRLGNYAQANQHMQAYTPVNAIDMQWRTLELLFLEALQNPHADINAQKEMLVSIAEAKGPLADLAADILRFTNEHSPYPYPTPLVPTADLSLNLTHVSDNRLSLQTYPNPVHDIIHINIITNKEVSDYRLCLLDVTGKKIADYPIQFVAGQYKLNVESLTPGMYLISLYNNDHIESIRFIKQ